MSVVALDRTVPEIDTDAVARPRTQRAGDVASRGRAGELVADPSAAGRSWPSGCSPCSPTRRGPGPGQDPAARADQAAGLAGAPARGHLAGPVAGQRGGRGRLRLDRICRCRGVARSGITTATSCAAGWCCWCAGQVIRPGYRWLLRQRQRADARRGPDGPRPERLPPTGARRPRDATGWASSDALNKITWMVIRKGGLVRDITVGDCIELTAALQEHHFRGSAGRPLFYALLKETGVLPAGAPERLRALRIGRSPQHRADRRRVRHRVQARPGPAGRVPHRAGSRAGPHLAARRSPATCAGCSGATWRSTIPASTRSSWHPQVARAWKERLAYIRDADGQPVRPRVNYRSELVFVRAFYEDIARWAADDPARWAPWVAPCPVKAAECTTKKSRSRVKSRMDQRTRTQLPLLPALLRAVEQQRKDAEERISTARGTPAGDRVHRRRAGVPALPARCRPAASTSPRLATRQAAQPHPRGGGRVLVVGDRGSPAAHRHPD